MKSIIQLFEESVEKYSSNPFLWEKIHEKYESISYSETKEQICQFAAGLLKLGIKKGDRIALISEGRNYWVISELGILYTGAINVPLSIKLDAESELKFRLEHSEAKIIITSKNQLKKIYEIKDKLPCLEKIILLDNKNELADNEIFIDDIFSMGKQYLQNNKQEFESIYKSIQGSDYANISYTSGTTADPKGIILTHRNYTSNVEQACSLMSIPEYYKTLIILPLDHSFAHTAGIYSFMAYGASIATVKTGKTPIETLKNIPIAIKEIKPNILLSVPALAKKFKTNIEKGISEKGKTAEKLFNLALKLSYSYNKDGWNKGKGLHKLKKPLIKLFDKILFSKIREGFGGQLAFFIGGGALLDIELQRFFYAIGMPMFQGYGLSEASPIISSNAEHKHKLGSSGFLVENIKLKICDEDGNKLAVGEKGEIVVKGENIMVGYWKNEEATNATIKDGWLYTGDMGYLDKDGFLYILGRFKSLLISNDGEKFSPEGIEEAFTQQSKYIEQVMLHNNQNPYTIGLIVPNKEAIKQHIKQKGLNLNIQEGKETAAKLIQSELEEYKGKGKFAAQFPERWLPSAIAIIDEPFTEQNQMINSTMKMVRGKITEFYKEKIDYLYTPEAKNICNKLNIEAISRFENN
ncbi:MAG: AMP-binding protein [Bacteroidales bacterium]|nr:AMP-binding protein [Bacteroidales bacterium]